VWAFYIIAFAEAFGSLFDYLLATYEFNPTIEYLLSLKQTVSIPALFLLTAIVLTKGADLGVKTLYIVVAILFIALVAFFVGQTDYNATHTFDPFINVTDSGGISESFFIVFAVIFPAFTGMTAGVGLSGDLKNPGQSIPLGTLAGTISGMVIYFFIAYKLSVSASPADLADTDQLVMAKIAWQGWWLIPVGLAAATISSALGSIMVAPRTLQAIARDHLIPSNRLNAWLSRGRGKGDDPFNATLITVAVAFVFVLIGGLNAVAGIISMFFMVTYGSLCLISFLQHFAADPSYSLLSNPAGTYPFLVQWPVLASCFS
jgi:amino acid transporter